MRLEFSGIEEIAERVEHVWTQLLDHRVVASCAPGVESVEAIDATHFRVIAGLGAGSVKLRFALLVELADLEPPTRARMVVRGDAPGSAMHAESSATLEPLGPASTRLAWTVSSDVHGTIANVGARLLSGTAKRMTAAFWKKFAKRVARDKGMKAAKRAGTKR